MPGSCPCNEQESLSIGCLCSLYLSQHKNQGREVLMREKICCASGSWPGECCLCSRMGLSLAGWQRHRRKEGGRKEGRTSPAPRPPQQPPIFSLSKRLASCSYSIHERYLNSHWQRAGFKIWLRVSKSYTLLLPHEKFCGPRFRLRVRFCVRERRRRRNGIGEPSLPLQQFSRLYMYEETHPHTTLTWNYQALF